MNRLSFVCPGCGKTTVLSEKFVDKMMSELDPKYPARTHIVTCQCKEYQVVFGARIWHIGSPVPPTDEEGKPVDTY